MWFLLGGRLHEVVSLLENIDDLTNKLIDLLNQRSLTQKSDIDINDN